MFISSRTEQGCVQPTTNYIGGLLILVFHIIFYFYWHGHATLYQGLIYYHVIDRSTYPSPCQFIIPLCKESAHLQL